MVAGLMMVEDLMEVTLVEVIWTLEEISDHPNLFLYLVSINMYILYPISIEKILPSVNMRMESPTSFLLPMSNWVTSCKYLLSWVIC